ncbi:hypothetical protein [Leifsonia sp. Leaf264]|uniref:hypothetical protein n=1 Tax=Leifsonia sp. Leaf264 TaxID=1736314 RepID=UPI0006FB704C|nr:hypothetical protein [Leifsonia sp. Leaf264]KQO98796.1 hypothetical protein ASF30_12095 [Leifsonia sp. Leaf264]
MDAVHARRRVARNRVECTSNGSQSCSPIYAGFAFLELMELPGQSTRAKSAGSVLRAMECANCADAAGRSYLLEPIPDGQVFAPSFIEDALVTEKVFEYV